MKYNSKKWVVLEFFKRIVNICTPLENSEVVKAIIEESMDRSRKRIMAGHIEKDKKS